MRRKNCIIYSSLFGRYHPYSSYSNNSNCNNVPTTSQSQSSSSTVLKTESAVSSVSTSGAPLSPLVEPHSNTSTPLVDEPHMTQRQRNGTGDDGEFLYTCKFFPQKIINQKLNFTIIERLHDFDRSY